MFNFGFLDIQLPFLYIQLIPKRVLIKRDDRADTRRLCLRYDGFLLSGLDLPGDRLTGHRVLLAERSPEKGPFCIPSCDPITVAGSLTGKGLDK